MINQLNPKDLYMSIHLGTGETPDGTKFNMASSPNNGAIIITFDDKKEDKKGNITKYRYMLDMQKFVGKCDEMRLIEIKKNKKK